MHYYFFNLSKQMHCTLYPSVEIGYAGGAGGANVQPNLASSNGFVAYAYITPTGLTLQTDQLPAVNNFDNSNPVWALAQVSCTFLVARP